MSSIYRQAKFSEVEIGKPFTFDGIRMTRISEEEGAAAVEGGMQMRRVFKPDETVIAIESTHPEKVK